MNINYHERWVGIVEDRNDPIKLRCRVRIIGVHPNSKAQVPTEALPWASISCPPTSMLSLMMPKEGDTVDGYFMQGNPDFPVITGVIHGIRLEDQNNQVGFNDPRTPEMIVTAPRPAKGIVYEQIGFPSLPLIVLEDVKLLQQTTVHKANQNREHVCDISGEMKKSAALLRLKFSEIMETIRTAIKNLLKAMGLIPDGETSYLLEFAKKLARELKDIQRRISEISDISTVIVAYARKVRAMIDYINSLPSKLYNLLKQCLANLVESLTTGFSDLFSLSGKSDFGEALEVFKDIKTTTGKIYSDSIKIIATPVAIVNALTNPASASDIADAGNALNTYVSNQNLTSTTTDLTKFKTN